MLNAQAEAALLAEKTRAASMANDANTKQVDPDREKRRLAKERNRFDKWDSRTYKMGKKGENGELQRLSDAEAKDKLDKFDNKRRDGVEDLQDETEMLKALAERNEVRNSMKSELAGKELTPAELLGREDGFLTADSGIGADSGVGAMVTPEKLESMQPYPGVDYLGAGYDIFRGNPEGDEHNLLDPGFRQPVRSVSYTGVTMTRDNQYLTPDDSYSLPLRSCFRAKSLVDTSSETSLQSSFARDVNAGGSVGFSGAVYSGHAQFEFSYGSREAKANSMARSESRMEAKSYCSKYQVRRGTAAQLTRHPLVPSECALATTCAAEESPSLPRACAFSRAPVLSARPSVCLSFASPISSKPGGLAARRHATRRAHAAVQTRLAQCSEVLSAA